MLKRYTQIIPDLFKGDDSIYPMQSIRIYIFGAFVLLLSGLKLFNNLENVMDIQFADEAAYIRFGLDLFEQMNRNWGPMYSLWYKALSFITTDTIQLYYLNYALSAIAIALLLYIFLLRIAVSPILALLIAFSILISNLNVAVWPRISHFCIVLLLFFLILLTFIKSKKYKFLLFALLCLIVSYARPEFYLAYLLVMFASAIVVYYNKERLSNKDYIAFAVLIIIMAVLHLIFRFPSNDFFGYNRGVAAFYQHYAYNFKVRTNANIDSWLYWEDICKQQFGDCNSMWCVIKTQPMIVISNTLFNIKNYVIGTLFSAFSYVFPIQLFSSKKIQFAIIILLSLLFITLCLRKSTRRDFIEQFTKRRTYLLLLLLFIAPTILSCIVVFPREHYVYLQMPFVLLLLVSLLNPFFQKRIYHPVLLFAFGVLCFMATPNIKSYSFLKVNNSTNFLCNKELVKQLRDNFAGNPHTLFTNMPFVRGMLPTNFKEINTIFDKKKHIPFSHYLDSAKIDIVILTPSTFRDPHILSDSSWIDFIDKFATYNFSEVRFNDCETYLLVKQPE